MWQSTGAGVEARSGHRVQVDGVGRRPGGVRGPGHLPLQILAPVTPLEGGAIVAISASFLSILLQKHDFVSPKH